MNNVIKSSQVKLSKKIFKLNGSKQDVEVTENTINLENSEVNKFFLESSKNEANSIINKAKIESQKIYDTKLNELKNLTKNIQDENLNITENARKDGFDKGYEDGKKEAEKLISQAQLNLDESNQTKEKILEGLEPQILNLIKNILDKLISSSVYINPQIILHLIKSGLDNSNTTEDLSIRVSADDYDFVSEHKIDLLKHISSNININIVNDVSLNKNDCIIETNFGTIESSLNLQLESLKNDLKYISKER